MASGGVQCARARARPSPAPRPESAPAADL